MNNKKYTSYFKLRRVYRVGLGIFAALFIIIAIVTYYGQNTGNFVIGVDDIAYNKGIVISKDPEFKTQGSRVMANPLDNVDAVTYSDFSGLIPKMVATPGDFKDPYGYTYLAFTFYLKNVGSEVFDVSMTLDVVEDILNVSDAVRILLIETNNQNGAQSMYLYQKEDDPTFDYSIYVPDYIDEDSPLLNTIKFESETQVCNQIIRAFRPNDVKQYTLLIWLEGWDPDCDNRISQGKIKMQMMFSIIGEEEEE